MKKTLLFLAIIASLFVMGCGDTDVPLSLSTKIQDNRLLGYWQLDDSSAIWVRKTENDHYIYEDLDYDRQLKKYISKENQDALYFTSIKDGNGVSNFISAGSNDEYFTVKFVIDPPGDLTLSFVSKDFLAKYFKEDKDDIIRFGSSDSFREFIEAHINEPGLYAKEAMHYKKKESLKSLDVPGAR